MATIKLYTDLEQSKKLAEILPLESADMVLPFSNPKNDVHIPGYVVSRNYVEVYNEMIKLPATQKEDIYKLIQPCWSLAALINVLPRNIEFNGDKYYLRFMKEYIEYANDEVSITGRCLHTTGNDNLVDACYEMILKLNELKRL